MKKMICIPAVIILQLFFCAAMGNDSDTLIINTGKTAAGNDSSAVSNKICSCRLMDVQTSRYEKELVGIFAEMMPEGKMTSNYRLMDELIRRETVYFRIVFAKSAEVRETFRSATDCRSLYFRLKATNSRLRLYNILDADILAGLVKR